MVLLTPPLMLLLDDVKPASHDKRPLEMNLERIGHGLAILLVDDSVTEHKLRPLQDVGGGPLQDGQLISPLDAVDVDSGDRRVGSAAPVSSHYRIVEALFVVVISQDKTVLLITV